MEIVGESVFYTEERRQMGTHRSGDDKQRDTRKVQEKEDNSYKAEEKTRVTRKKKEMQQRRRASVAPV